MTHRGGVIGIVIITVMVAAAAGQEKGRTLADGQDQPMPAAASRLQDLAPAASAIRLLMEEEGMVPPEGEPVKCGLSAINHALHVRQEARGERLQSVREILARPTMQASILQGQFRVHFDTTGTHTPALLDANGNRLPGTARAFVDSVFASLAFVLPMETQTLGYGALPADGTLGGGPEYDIFILELGTMYGYTTPDSFPAEGGTSTTFIAIDNDFIFVRPSRNRGLPGMRVTVAHELHHALQIGNYGYWTNHVFFYEITSTWMEDVVYPEVDDYLNYLGSSVGHFRNPDKSFASNELTMYSRSVWGHYVSKRFGIDAMRACWTGIRLVPPLEAIDIALRNLGADFTSAFTEWSLWNLFTGVRSDSAKYYPEGAAYPAMVQVARQYTAAGADLEGSLPALGSRYYQLIRPPDTMTVILNNTDVAGAATGVPVTRSYTYRFRSSRPDDSYRLTPLGLYASLDVPDLSAWSTWFVLGDTIQRNFDPDAIKEGKAFPNPFLPGLHTRVCIPVQPLEQVHGTLYVYSAGMDLLYSSGNISSSLYVDRQVFFWEGRGDDGSPVPSGVYFYVLDLPGHRIRGKIAVVRR